jgi:hypothetical protein
MKEQAESTLRLQERVCGKYFIELSKETPSNVQWYKAAYAYGRYHQLHCKVDMVGCEDCRGVACAHIMTKCLECKKTICNLCTWTCVLACKDKFLAGSMSEFQSCLACKNIQYKKVAKWGHTSTSYEGYSYDDQTYSRGTRVYNNSVSTIKSNNPSVDDSSVSNTQVDTDQWWRTPTKKVATWNTKYQEFLKNYRKRNQPKFTTNSDDDQTESEKASSKSSNDEWDHHDRRNSSKASSKSSNDGYESNIPSPMGQSGDEISDNGNGDPADTGDDYDSNEPHQVKLTYDWHNDSDDDLEKMWGLI